MNKEIICIDGGFSENALIFFRKHNVITPEQDIMYNIRDLIVNSTGENGFLLEEIVNPKVPIPHPMGGTIRMETNWNVNRFRNLDNSVISMTELKQELKEKNVLI